MDWNAIIIGNSDGIGLSVTKELLRRGWTVKGVSKSESLIQDNSYSHYIADVQSADYAKVLRSIVANSSSVDLCIYCAGIGELLDVANMAQEESIFMVNLIGLVRTVSGIIPQMADQKSGHFLGLSSLADDMLSIEAPSYHASKAGFSNYLEGLALALKPHNIAITNVRFGFVDTKMAKGDVKPFIMSVQRAMQHVMRCIDKKPVRYTAPKIAMPLIWLRRWALKMKTMQSSNV